MRPIHGNLTPLRERLEEEIERAQTSYGELSVMCIALPELSGAAATLSFRSRGWPRSWGPSCGRSTPWPAMGRATGAAPARSQPRRDRAVGAGLEPLLASLCPTVRIGFACFPEEGPDAASLLSGAQAAAGGAAAREVRSASGAVTQLRIGEQGSSSLMRRCCACIRCWSVWPPAICRC